MRSVIAGAACLIVFGSASGAPATVPAEPAPAIIGRALAPNSPLAEDLRRLTDGVGGRVSGSPAMARAVEWGVAAFRAAGVSVRAETYTQPLTWAEGATRLEVLGSAPFPVALVAEGWSPATPVGGIEAELVHVGNGTAADYAAAGARVRGAIVLVDSTVTETWADLFNEYNRTGEIIERAISGGAKAILWTSARERRLLYRHTDTVAGELASLPMAVVAREDALRLARAADRAPLRVRFTMPNVIGGPVEVANVVAEIRGRELPDEYVVLGAHLDSWDLGTGALDNGCNAALVVAAARAIRESGFVPRRTIRFVLFSGEEEGMLGSRAYVKQHRAELDRTRAMLAIDSGIGRITGFQVSGRTDVAASLPKALAGISALGAGEVLMDGDLGTDNVDFMLEGVPTLVAAQEPANYMQNYHAASDTYDKVDLHQLAQHVAIAAGTVYGIADLDAPLAPRQSRAEIEALLERTGLAKEMKESGLWPEWASFQRGRTP
jgi:carboxypeptidase Q